MALLEARGVTRRPFFAGRDLDLAAGEIVAVSGPSGSGKTLFLRAFADLDPADAGEVRLDGAGAGDRSTRRPGARGCSTSTRPGSGSPGTVADNLARVAELRRAAGARARIRAGVDGLDPGPRRIGCPAARPRRWRWTARSPASRPGAAARRGDLGDGSRDGRALGGARARVRRWWRRACSGSRTTRRSPVAWARGRSDSRDGRAMIDLGWWDLCARRRAHPGERGREPRAAARAGATTARRVAAHRRAAVAARAGAAVGVSAVGPVGRRGHDGRDDRVRGVGGGAAHDATACGAATCSAWA